MIQLFKPMMDTKACLQELDHVLHRGWLGRGPLVAAFEQLMAQRVGAKHFIATSSCTEALRIAVHCLDLKLVSLVVTTPITFAATNAAITWERLYPLFVDVDAVTGLADLGSITGNVSAAMVVHLGGRPIDTSVIPEGVKVIEDCAHALGSNLPPARGPRCWSFHAVKNLPMGDGGGISTDDDELAERYRRLRWMGITKDTRERSEGSYRWEYDIPELGFKASMNDLQAAIGLAMLPHLDEHNARRKVIAKRYAEAFDWNAYSEDSSCHFMPIFVRNRDKVMAHLAEKGIESGVHYRRNDAYAPFKPYARELPGVDWYEKHELTLPLHPGLSDEDVETVIKSVKEAL